MSDIHWNDLPSVSILLAVRNEEQHLDRCLKSISELDYPRNKTEIIVIDGMSTDRTPAIIETWRKRDSRVRALTNPRKVVSAGMNLGLAAASSELILWLSGHSLLKPDHLRRSVATMSETGAAAVGGVLETVGLTEVGKINAAVLSSRFGVGGGSHRVGTKSGWVPAVTMALYRKDAITAVGGFDETLTRNQDNVLHDRLNRSGYRSYLDIGIKPIYLCRETLPGLLQQAWQNGYWNLMLLRLGHAGLHLRHFIPMLFVVVLAALVAAAVSLSLAAPLLPAYLALYGTAAAVASIITGVRRRFSWQILVLPIWYFLLHLAYGTGSLLGALAPNAELHRR